MGTGGGPARSIRPIFVIQEHHAHALHWDFRLEHDDVLVSWALPKGVPLDPARNHLAVHTEDHPMAYADFEGDIPRGEYGGGHTSIWDRGEFEVQKWSDREVMVVLHGDRVSGRYVLFRTGGKNWMIHRMDPSPAGFEALPASVAPMLAVADRAGVDRRRLGVRVQVGRGTCGLLRRRRPGQGDEPGREGADRSFPELRDLGAFLGSRPAVLDGELVAFDNDGRPDFGRLQHRLNVSSPGAVARRAARSRRPTSSSTCSTSTAGRCSTDRTTNDELRSPTSPWRVVVRNQPGVPGRGRSRTCSRPRMRPASKG